MNGYCKVDGKSSMDAPIIHCVKKQMYVCIYICIYIYIYRERERDMYTYSIWGGYYGAHNSRFGSNQGFGITVFCLARYVFGKPGC